VLLPDRAGVIDHALRHCVARGQQGFGRAALTQEGAEVQIVAREPDARAVHAQATARTSSMVTMTFVSFLAAFLADRIGFQIAVPDHVGPTQQHGAEHDGNRSAFFCGGASTSDSDAGLGSGGFGASATETSAATTMTTRYHMAISPEGSEHAGRERVLARDGGKAAVVVEVAEARAQVAVL
jgi:hypothetical protein